MKCSLIIILNFSTERFSGYPSFVGTLAHPHYSPLGENNLYFFIPDTLPPFPLSFRTFIATHSLSGIISHPFNSPIAQSFLQPFRLLFAPFETRILLHAPSLKALKIPAIFKRSVFVQSLILRIKSN